MDAIETLKRDLGLDSLIGSVFELIKSCGLIRFGSGFIDIWIHVGHIHMDVLYCKSFLFLLCGTRVRYWVIHLAELYETVALGPVIVKVLA